MGGKEKIRCKPFLYKRKYIKYILKPGTRLRMGSLATRNSEFQEHYAYTSLAYKDQMNKLLLHSKFSAKFPWNVLKMLKVEICSLTRLTYSPRPAAMAGSCSSTWGSRRPPTPSWSPVTPTPSTPSSSTRWSRGCWWPPTRSTGWVSGTCDGRGSACCSMSPRPVCTSGTGRINIPYRTSSIN